jgi:hypothetical protein
MMLYKINKRYSFGIFLFYILGYSHIILSYFTLLQFEKENVLDTQMKIVFLIELFVYIETTMRILKCEIYISIQVCSVFVLTFISTYYIILAYLVGNMQIISLMTSTILMILATFALSKNIKEEYNTDEIEHIVEV